MNQSLLQKVGLNVGILLLGILIGSILVYKYKPRTVSTVETKTNTVIQDHIVTVIKTVKQPDGASETETTVTDNTIHDIIQQRIDTKAPQYHISIGAETTIDLIPTYSLQVEKRIAGPLYIGARAETRGAVGVTIGLEF